MRDIDDGGWYNVRRSMTSRTTVAIAKVRPLCCLAVCVVRLNRGSATDRGHITAESRTSVLTAQGRFVRTEENGNASWRDGIEGGTIVTAS